MDDSSYKSLKRELVIATLAGSYQTRGLVYKDQKHPKLRVYMYKEDNHKKPHVHVYWKGDGGVSVCIETLETLAGRMDSKFLKIIKGWIQSHEAPLLDAWTELQQGKKPSVLWED